MIVRHNITGAVWVEDRMPKWEPAANRGLWALSDLRFEQLSQDEEEVLLWSKGRTWVNITVRPCIHSFLTHRKHHHFENKVWEIYIFIRNWSRHYRLMMFLHVSVYLYMYTWSCIVAIQQTVLFQTIQFNISAQFNCQKHFYFKQFSLIKQF